MDKTWLQGGKPRARRKHTPSTMGSEREEVRGGRAALREGRRSTGIKGQCHGLNGDPLTTKRSVHILIPGTCERGVIWKRALEDAMQ